jgi:hypothetical protein
MLTNACKQPKKAILAHDLDGRSAPRDALATLKMEATDGLSQSFTPISGLQITYPVRALV